MGKVKFLVMDVDGTLTDGKIYMGENGELFKVFDVKDGCGICDLLIPSGIIPVIITGRESKIVKNRCIELGITEIYQNAKDKIEQINILLDKYNTCKESYGYGNIAYIGDDRNDLPAMQLIKANNGFVGCPKDAGEEVVRLCDYVCKRNGGRGAVREFIERLLKED